MEEYAVSSLIEAEGLLGDLYEVYDIGDVPLTQEMIDAYFSKMCGDISEMSGDTLNLACRVLNYYDNSEYIDSFAIFLQAGPQIRDEDYVLHFPKIIARLNYG